MLEIVDGTPPLAFPVSAVNNGERKGAVWGSGGGWNDATANAYPDDVQIDFNGSKTIDRVVVYTLQDNYSSPMEPTDTLMFSAYGVTAFTVEGWNGSGWTVLGSVSQQQPGEADGDVRALQHQRDPNPSDAGTRPIFASG